MKRRFSDEQIIGMIKAYEAGVKAQEARGGSGNLNSRDRWIFRATAA